MTDKEYTLLELIKSTCVRAQYNIDLADKEQDPIERHRFLVNAKSMLKEVEFAIEENNTWYLMDNKDW